MKTEKDIVYGQVQDRDLSVDIFRPDGNETTRTAIILLHGGAWRFGDRSMMEIFAPELVRHGFVALAPEYRLLDEAPWPAQIEDVKTVIRWARKNAEYLDIFPDRVVLQGFSAGAHLALLAAGTADSPDFEKQQNNDISDGVSAVIAFFPPIEFTTDSPSPGGSDAAFLLGGKPTREAARSISPIHHVHEKFPPTFLLHGMADTMVSPLTSQRLFEALHALGVPVEMHLFPHHTHEFVRLPSMLATVQAEIALFLRRMVVDPEKYIEENLALNQFATR